MQCWRGSSKMNSETETESCGLHKNSIEPKIEPCPMRRTENKQNKLIVPLCLWVCVLSLSGSWPPCSLPPFLSFPSIRTISTYRHPRNGKRGVYPAHIYVCICTTITKERAVIGRLVFLSSGFTTCSYCVHEFMSSSHLFHTLLFSLRNSS